MTGLPDECDFCDQQLDEGEELEPIWIGGPPRPRGSRADTTAEQPTVRNPHAAGEIQQHMLGRTAGEWKALEELLRESPQIGFDTSPRVREVKQVGERDPVTYAEDADAKLQRLESEVDNDTAGATLEIRPDPEWPEPDLEVCPACADSIGEEGDRP